MRGQVQRRGFIGLRHVTGSRAASTFGPRTTATIDRLRGAAGGRREPVAAGHAAPHSAESGALGIVRKPVAPENRPTPPQPITTAAAPANSRRLLSSSRDGSVSNPALVLCNWVLSPYSAPEQPQEPPTLPWWRFLEFKRRSPRAYSERRSLASRLRLTPSSAACRPSRR